MMRYDSADATSLRDVAAGDLDIFFEHQLDASAIHMAAFTVEDPTDVWAFKARWSKHLADPSIVNKTIVYAGRVAGHIAIFGPPEEREVTFWLGREFWGRGLASAALRALTIAVIERPLYARAAADNAASIRVLQNVGFVISGHEKSFASARGAEIDEVRLVLEA